MYEKSGMTLNYYQTQTSPSTRTWNYEYLGPLLVPCTVYPDKQPRFPPYHYLSIWHDRDPSTSRDVFRFIATHSRMHQNNKKYQDRAKKATQYVRNVLKLWWVCSNYKLQPNSRLSFSLTLLTTTRESPKLTVNNIMLLFFFGMTLSYAYRLGSFSNAANTSGMEY